jgi:hypothetical protein
MTVGQPPRIQLAAHEHGRSQTAEALHPPPGPITPPGIMNVSTPPRLSV